MRTPVSQLKPGFRAPSVRIICGTQVALRHENAVLRRHAGRVRYNPADRMWFAALARLIPRNRWTEVFP